MSEKEFEDWCNSTCSSILSLNLSKDDENLIDKYISQLISGDSLEDPFKNETNWFLDNFCAKIVTSILNKTVQKESATSLNSILQKFIPLFTKYIINAQSKFISSMKDVFLNAQCPFYSLQNSFGFFSNSLIKENISQLSSTDIIPQLLTLYKTPDALTPKSMYWTLKLLKTFNKKHYKSVLPEIADRTNTLYISFLQSKDLEITREIDTSQHAFILKFITKHMEDYNPKAANFSDLLFLVSVRQVFCISVKKSFDTLASIKKEIKLNEDKMKLLLESDFLDFVLTKDVHQQIIAPLYEVLLVLFQTKKLDHEYLIKLWNKFVKNPPAEIETNLKEFQRFFNSLESATRDKLWAYLQTTKTFSDFSYKFIQGNYQFLTDDCRGNLVRNLLTIFDCNNKEQVLLLSKLIPKNQEICDNTLNLCLEILKEKRNIREVMLIYQSSIRYANHQKVIESFIPLLNSVELLDKLCPEAIHCLKTVLVKFENMTNEEFQAFKSFTIKMLQKDTESILELYQKLADKTELDMMNDEMLHSLIKHACKLTPVCSKFIILIFNTLNYDVIKEKGPIEKIQDLNYIIQAAINDENSELLDTAAKLYENNIDKFVISTKDYLESNIVLQAYLGFIKRIELKHDDEVYRITRNKHDSPLKMSTIEIKGTNLGKIKVPMSITYEALREKIGYKLNQEKESLQIFLENNVEITAQNMKLEEQMTVTINNGSFPKDFRMENYSNFPSPVLLKYREEIWHLMIKKNNETAFYILYYLPTLKEIEDKLLETESDGWNTVLSTRHPFSLLYKVNALGNLLDNNTEFTNKFINGGGIIRILELAVDDIDKIYEKREFQEMVIDAAYLSVQKLNDGKIIKKSKIIDKITEIVHDLIENPEQKKHSDHYISLFIIILQKLPDLVKTSEEIKSLLPKLMFYGSESVRTTFQELFKLFDPSVVEKTILDLLPTAKKEKSTYYFKILSTFVENTKNDFIYNEMKQILKEIYQSSLFIDYAQMPPKPYIASIFSVLSKLISNFDESLYNLIVETIICTKFKYYSPIKEILVTLNEMIKYNQPILTTLLPTLNFQLSQIQDEKRLRDYCAQYAHDELDDLIPEDVRVHAGLTNMGCTCYLNSTLQQLYNVQEFRDLLIKSSPEKKWLQKLKEVFTQLETSRSPVNPSSFVKSWLWYGEHVNPYQQQDAVEFLQALLDDINNEIPGATNPFKGEMKAIIEGVDVEYHFERDEEFITFPVEVSNNDTLESSFKSFKNPILFDGDNKYTDEKLGKISAKMFHKITKPPTVLVIQLMRFTYNMSTNQRLKVNSKYLFPEKLDLSDLMSDQSEHVIYDLTGVLVHIGSANGGHYYSYVNNKDNWICYNDSRVSKSNMSSVMKSTGGGKNSESAYLIFYTKSSSEVKEKPKEEAAPIKEEKIEQNFVYDEEIESILIKDLNDFILKMSDYTDNPIVGLTFLFNDQIKVDQEKIKQKIVSKTKEDPYFIYNKDIVKLGITSSRNQDFFFNLVSDAIKNTKNYQIYVDFLCQNFSDIIKKDQQTFRIIIKPIQIVVDVGAKSDSLFKVVTSFLDSCQAQIERTKIGLVLHCNDLFDSLRKVVEEKVTKEKDQVTIDEIKKIINHKAIQRIEGATDQVCQLKCLIMTDDNIQELRNNLKSSDDNIRIDSFVTLCQTRHFNEAADVKKNATTSMTSFLCQNLSKYCSSSMQPFFAEAKWWIMEWLLSTLSEVRLGVKRALFKSFPTAKNLTEDDFDAVMSDSDKQNLKKVSENLFSEFESVGKFIYKESNDNYFSFTTPNIFKPYLEVLTWSIVRTDNQQIIINGYEQIFYVVKKFSSVSTSKQSLISDVLTFLIRCLKKEDFAKFFSDQSKFVKFFDVLSKGLGGTKDGLRKIPEFIVKSEVPEYFTSLFTSKILENMILSLRPDISYSTEYYDLIIKYLPKSDKKVLKNLANMMNDSVNILCFANPGEPLLAKLSVFVIECDPSLSKIYIKSKLMPKILHRIEKAYDCDLILLAAILRSVRNTDLKFTEEVFKAINKVQFDFQFENHWILATSLLSVNDSFCDFSLNLIPEKFVCDDLQKVKIDYIRNAITFCRGKSNLMNVLLQKISKSLFTSSGQIICEWCNVVIVLLTKETPELCEILIQNMKSSDIECFGTSTKIYLSKCQNFGFNIEAPLLRVYELISNITENERATNIKRLLEFSLEFSFIKEKLKNLDENKVETMRKICQTSLSDERESVSAVDALNLIDIIFGKKQ